MRVGFVTPLVSDETTSNSTSFNRWTSSQRTDATAAETTEPSYCPDDYDNTGGDDAHEKLPSQPPSDRHSQRLGVASTSKATTPRTPIRSSEEESLDKIVAHLLGEVTPPSSACSRGLSTASDGQPTPSEPGTLPSLRWPQGDSLPRVGTRRKAGVGDYDVPVSSVSDKVVSEELSADENDNVVKNITVHGVVYDLPVSHQVNLPVDLPASQVNIVVINVFYPVGGRGRSISLFLCLFVSLFLC